MEHLTPSVQKRYCSPNSKQQLIRVVSSWTLKLQELKTVSYESVRVFVGKLVSHLRGTSKTVMWEWLKTTSCCCVTVRGARHV